MSKTIFLVTGNPNKIAELSAILKTALPVGWEVDHIELDLDEIQSPESEIVAQKKSVDALRNLPLEKQKNAVVVVDDTGLCFSALNGLPGALIKWFQTGIGNEKLVQMLSGFEDKKATAVCSLGISWLDAEEKVQTRIFEGRCEGKIVDPRGDNKFGFDPIFEPDEMQSDSAPRRTYAEMGADKNIISHRSRALEAFCAWLRTNPKL